MMCTNFLKVDVYRILLKISNKIIKGAYLLDMNLTTMLKLSDFECKKV